MSQFLNLVCAWRGGLLALLFAASTVFGETSLVVEELAQTAGNASRGNVKITLNTSEASDAPTALQLDLKFDPNKVTLTGVSLEGDAGYDLRFRVLSGGVARVVISSQRLDEIVSGTSFRIDAATVAGGAFESLQPFELSGVSVVENQSGSSVTTRVNKVRLKGTALDSLGLVALNGAGGSVLGKIQLLATDDAGEAIPKSVFQSGRKRYALGVPTGTSSLSVNPVAKDPLAQVRVGFNGGELQPKPSGSDRWTFSKESLTHLKVSVKLDDYETVYEVRMLGTDSRLEVELAATGKKLDFDGVRTFTGSSTESAVSLKFTLKDSRGTLKARVGGGVWQFVAPDSAFVMPLTIGDNTLDLLAIAEDGVTSNLYYVNLARSSVRFGSSTETNPASGSALVRAGIILSGRAAVAESGVLYTTGSGELQFTTQGEVPSGAKKMVAALSGGELSVRISGLSDGTWKARPYVRLQSGEYFYGAPTEFQSEGASEVNQLSDLRILGSALKPTFKPDIKVYSLEKDLSFSEESVFVYAKGKSPEAGVKLYLNNGDRDQDFDSGSFQNVALKVGENTIEVKVGTGKYTVKVVRSVMKGLTAGAIGTWEAVLGRGTNPQSAGLGGLLRVTTLKSGKCTMRLSLGAEVYTWTGEATMETLTRARVAAKISRPRSKDSLNIELSFGRADSSSPVGMTGSLTGLPSLPEGTLSVAGAKQVRLYGSGVQNFSIAIPTGASAADEGAIPRGWGFGSFKRTNTTVAYAMSLADGRSVTGSSAILEGLRVAVFAPLYRGTGSVLGLVNLQDANQALGGELSWFKRKQSGVNRGYGEGFGPVDVALEGGEYKAPARSVNVFGDQIATSCVVVMIPAFEGDGAMLSVANQLTFKPGFLSDFGVSRFTSRFAPREGIVSGGFDVVDPFDPLKIKRSARYFGMLIPGTREIRGYLLIPALPGPTQGQVLSDCIVIEALN